MPPRRAHQTEFLSCNHCGIIISKEFSGRHQQDCASFKEIFDSQKLDPKPCQSFLPILNLKSVSFPFLKNGVLYGLVVESTLSEQSRCLPNSAVLMHPSTMKLCKITTRASVVVQSHETETVHTVWPCSMLKKMCIAFANSHKAQHRSKEIVCVFPYRKAVCAASKITLSVDCGSNITYDDEFKDFLLYQLCDAYIGCGSLIKCYYNGLQCTLTIEDVLPSSSDCDFVSKDNEYSLSRTCSLIASELSDLSLNDYVNSRSKNTSYVDSLSHPCESESSCYETANQSGLTFCTAYSSSVNSDQRHTFLCDSKDIIHLNSACKNYFYVSSSTVLEIQHEQKHAEGHVCLRLQDVGGLQKQITAMKKHIGHLLNAESNCFQGLLFVGPPGVGKSFLVDVVGSSYNISFFKVTAPEIFLRYSIYNENKLKSVFKKAFQLQPSILFLDEIDLLCEMFSNSKGGVISELAELMDELFAANAKVLVIATASDSAKVNDALKHPGRLDAEVKFNIPDSQARVEILKCILGNEDHSIQEEQIVSLAEAAHGFSGFNMKQLCREVYFEKAKACSKLSSDEQSHDTAKLNFDDMETQLKQMKQIISRTEKFTVEKVHWEDIGGMHDVKEKLKQVVELPLKHPAIFRRFGLSPSHGVLLYGPPGCSKTMIAKALATESGLNFIPVKGPELFSKWVGESEKAVRDLFKRAREAAPCIIFFDEIDALVGERGSSDGADVEKRVVTQLLTEVDGAEQLEGVIIIAATNRPDILDPAMLRPGRLDHLIYVPLPDSCTRREIFRLKFKKMPVSDDIDMEWLVKQTHGYSGAEITAVCHEAALLAMSEDWPEVAQNPVIKMFHLESALNTILPRIPEETIQFYEMFSSGMPLGGK